MKKVITEHYFINSIVKDEYNTVTAEGARALFGYLEELEADTGEEMEFDRVAIRCDFSEYENLKEVLREYDSIKSLNDLRDNTVVIEVPDTNRLIIQEF